MLNELACIAILSDSYKFACTFHHDTDRGPGASLPRMENTLCDISALLFWRTPPIVRLLALGPADEDPLCHLVDPVRLERMRHDLVDGTRIYDFKTGKAKTASDIASSFSFDKPADYPDFQALAYLGILENEGMEDCSITFEYIENKGEDIMLGSGAGASSVKVVIGGTKTECVLELDKNPLGADSYKKIVLSDMLDICSGYGDPSGWQTDGDLIGEVVGRFGVTKRVAENAIKQVAKAMMKESFPSDGVLCVPKETMERFLRLVADAAEENVRYYSGVYPPKPRKGCDKCDYRDMCTMEPISGGEEDVA